MNDKDLKDIVNAYVMLARTGRPEVDYDGITNAIMALIAEKTTEAELKSLVKLLSEHDAVCGATFNKNPRDDCTLRQQVFNRISELQTPLEKGNQ